MTRFNVEVTDECFSFGRCVQMAPEVFSFGDNGVTEVDADAAERDEAAVRKAAESCPRFAIKIVEE